MFKVDKKKKKKSQEFNKIFYPKLYGLFFLKCQLFIKTTSRFKNNNNNNDDVDDDDDDDVLDLLFLCKLQ